MNFKTYQCKIIKDNDQFKYYKKSRKKFNNTYANNYSNHNTKKHCDQADNFNYSITYFRIHPSDLSNSKIAFDYLCSYL